MDVIGLPADFARRMDEDRRAGRTVGFVPTMGFFHEGHLSLMRRARTERDVVAVSIFVNPLQFGPTEDLGAYPRDPERDRALAAAEGVDVVFAPGVGDMYPGGEPAVRIDPGPLGARLEGASRPGHFAGVLTVVAKLFHLVGPAAAYFGEKDFQQLVLVRRTASDLSFPVSIVPCPTVREPDGLALSSRNVYLSPEERTAALCLSRALRRASGLVIAGERRARAVEAAMAAAIEAEPLADLDYAAVADEETLDPVDRAESPARALVAATVGKTRLIDNARLVAG